MSRFLHLPTPDEMPDEDPLAGVANLFDIAIVFIVGLMITLFSVFNIGDLMDQEVILDRGPEIEAYELTQEAVTGDGERLGTAYRLANGQVIYVPDEGVLP